MGGREGIQNMGAAAGVRISDAEADAIIANLNRRFTGVREWHKTIREATKQRIVTVELPMGHKRHLVGAKKRPQVVCNTLVQGTAAAGMKMGLMECAKDGLIKYMGGLIHDEVVNTNVPTNEAEDLKVAQEEALLRGMRKLIKNVPIESKVGQYWRYVCQGLPTKWILKIIVCITTMVTSTFLIVVDSQFIKCVLCAEWTLEKHERLSSSS